MKKLFTHENRIIIFNLKNVLEDAGIESLVINEFSAGGAGDLAPFDTWPELWVSDNDQLAKAKTILQNIVFESNEDYWFCPGCQEKNGGAFELCWNCGRASD